MVICGTSPTIGRSMVRPDSLSASEIAISATLSHPKWSRGVSERNKTGLTSRTLPTAAAAAACCSVTTVKSDVENLTLRIGATLWARHVGQLLCSAAVTGDQRGGLRLPL